MNDRIEWEDFSIFISRENIKSPYPKLLLAAILFAGGTIMSILLFLEPELLFFLLVFIPMAVGGVWAMNRMLKTIAIRGTGTRIERTAGKVRIVRNKYNSYGLVSVAKGEMFALLGANYRYISKISGDLYLMVSGTEGYEGVYDAKREKKLVPSIYTSVTVLEADKKIVCDNNGKHVVYSFDGKLIG